MVRGYILPLRLEPLGPVTHMMKHGTAYDPQVPGLIIHRGIGGSKGWTVAHTESGYWLGGGFSKKDTAAVFCQTVGEWTDWSQPVEALSVIERLQDRCGELAWQLRAEDRHVAHTRAEMRQREKAQREVEERGMH